MKDLLHSINSQITVVWVPSHIGITDNERADQLANMGCKRQHIDIQSALNCRNFTVELPLISTSCGNMHGTTRQLDDNVQPDVASRNQVLFETRSAEVLAHRPRLGKCRLNSCLHKIALHDTGTCDSCGEAETIEHYLINCSQNEIAAAVKNICDIYSVVK